MSRFGITHPPLQLPGSSSGWSNMNYRGIHRRLGKKEVLGGDFYGLRVRVGLIEPEPVWLAVSRQTLALSFLGEGGQNRHSASAGED